MSIYEHDVGEASWPKHWHSANEEAIFVLSGTGTFHGADDETIAIEP